MNEILIGIIAIILFCGSIMGLLSCICIYIDYNIYIKLHQISECDKEHLQCFLRWLFKTSIVVLSPFLGYVIAVMINQMSETEYTLFINEVCSQ